MTPVTDAESRRARRDRLVAQQTGIEDASADDVAPSVNEDSGSLFDQKIHQKNYHDVASQLTDPGGLIFNEFVTIAEDQAIACDGVGGLDGLGSAGLVGDGIVVPPDGQVPSNGDPANDDSTTDE